MPIKLTKVESGASLILERVMYTKRYTLYLDRSICVGCEICKAACPKEAIKIVKPSDFQDLEELPQRITVTVLEDKCNFCGICSEVCVFGAFKQSINGEEQIPVLKTESFPKIIHDIKVDETRCPLDCKTCEESCPLHLIKVNFSNEGRVKVDVNIKHCPGCRICEIKCPYDAMHVRKIISGLIKINTNLCPEGCRKCVDACPIPNVLFISNDGKVDVNDLFCVYCGACRNACPVEGALEIRRVAVYHTQVKSGAWNKALERLTSTGNMAKELRSKSTSKIYDSVRRLQMGGRVRK